MEIRIKKSVVTYLCNQTDRGYESFYKEERLGFLFGRIIKSGIYYVLKAYYYKGGIRKRTIAEYNYEKLIKRGNELSLKFGMRWNGMYHSHEEIAGEKSWGLSRDDRTEEPHLPIELLVSVWAKVNSRVPHSSEFRLKVVRGNYQYLFSGYIRRNTGLKLVPTIAVKD